MASTVDQAGRTSQHCTEIHNTASHSGTLTLADQEATEQQSCGSIDFIPSTSLLSPALKETDTALERNFSDCGIETL